METCVRGFSFMPETKLEDLKYVESEALERTWKTARRERQKQQEQKIWEEFINEQDIVQNICREDPYQFLNQLPQECIQELLDVELQKMREENGENKQEEEHTEEPDSMAVELDTHHTVVCSEEIDKEECNIFNIFDDEDKDDELSGEDKEQCDNESNVSPPCTVRERQDDVAPYSELESSDKISRKSSGENVANMIEGSIYCAKVKDLRVKINEELLNIVGQLEKKDIINIDPMEFPKLMRRSVEFSARFHRVHVYQLQRQIADIERHSSRTPALAVRTHYQAQLARAAALHASLLHALQVFCRSLPQTACVRESGDMLKLVVSLVSEATRVCNDARPNTLLAAAGLFDDSVQSSCDALYATVDEYTRKMVDYMASTENTSVSCSRRSNKLKGRKRSVGTWSKSGTKSLLNTEAALSMYSLCTQRAASGARPASSKGDQSSGGTSKMHLSISGPASRLISNKDGPAKSPKKSPKSRRPLMRAPQRTRPRRAPPEQDVRTLVETVAPCASSHVNREASLEKTKNAQTPPSKETPRSVKPKESSRTPVHVSPRVNYCFNAESPAGKVQSPINKTAMEDTTILAKKRESSPSKSPKLSEEDCKPADEEPKRTEKERSRSTDAEPISCEITRLVRQLCGGDNKLGMKSERVSGAKNAQLLCVTGGSPRQPSTPQLLRILEETIQKKTPRPLFPRSPDAAKDTDKLRMNFNIPESVSDALFNYRTKFVQHMLSSSMYANSAVGKPWEKIASISEKIIDDLLLHCANKMEIQDFVNQLYKNETQ